MNFLALVLFSIVANASSLIEGPISVSGNGCYGDLHIVPVSGEKNRFELPIKVNLDKKSKTPFERKICNMRLPISLKANRKLQISDISQVVRIDGRGIKSTLSISVAGKKGKPLTTTGSKTVVAEGLVVESDCGHDVILTVDLNVVASGNEIVSANTELVQVTLKIVNCN